MSIPIHPACAKWPRPSAAEFEALVADIKANGLLNPIWLTEANEILEGKIRYHACLQTNVPLRFETYRGDDPIGFTISQNKHRRHLSAAQLALIGEELAVLKAHRPSNCAREHSKSQTEVAQQLGIARESINDARALKKYAEPNVVELVRTNQVGLKNAACYARHTPREEQRIADRKTVKAQGNQLRAPLKNGITSKRMVPGIKPKQLSSIKFSSEQAQELNEKLRPLIKRLRHQSKQHIASFCPFELECIAHDMDKLLEQWANAGSPASARQVSGN